MTGKLNESAARAALAACNAVFSKSQRDGWGFVSVADNNVARGRYLDPENYVGFGIRLPQFLQRVGAEEGTLPKQSNFLLCHGRQSTNRVCLANVHPFVKDGYYLAHNGVVSWKGTNASTPESVAGCDSEQLLTWLCSGGTWAETHDAWGGYGAIILVDSKEQRMVIAKEGCARLSIAKRAVGSGWVASTDPEDLIWICRQAGIGLATRPIAMPQRLVYFDRSGAIVDDQDWKGFGTRVYDADCVRSMGPCHSDYQPGFHGAGMQPHQGKRRKGNHHHVYVNGASTAAVIGREDESRGDSDPKPAADSSAAQSAKAIIDAINAPTEAELKKELEEDQAKTQAQLNGIGDYTGPAHSQPNPRMPLDEAGWGG